MECSVARVLAIAVHIARHSYKAGLHPRAVGGLEFEMMVCDGGATLVPDPYDQLLPRLIGSVAPHPTLSPGGVIGLALHRECLSHHRREIASWPGEQGLAVPLGDRRRYRNRKGVQGRNFVNRDHLAVAATTPLGLAAVGRQHNHDARDRRTARAGWWSRSIPGISSATIVTDLAESAKMTPLQIRSLNNYVSPAFSVPKQKPNPTQMGSGMFSLTKHASAPCFGGNGRTYTYAEVHEFVEPFRLRMEGRSLVICLCENSVHALIGYVAFMVHNQVPLLVEAGLPSTQLRNLVEKYRPNFAWIPYSRASEFDGGILVHRLGEYALLRLAGPTPADPPLNSHLQLLLPTSGSTGSSKLVRLSQENLQANAASISSFLCIRSEDVAITTLPFSYSFGLSIINTHLIAGASIQVTESSPLNREFWDLVQRAGVTSLSGVPYTFTLLKRIRFERFEIDSIRYLSQAGGKLNHEQLEYLQRISRDKNLPCYVMYGQTEASARMSYLPPEWLQRKPGSVGNAIPNGRFEIVDEDSAIVQGAGVMGQLVYHGPNVAMGYAEARADLARSDDWNGRLLTGDLAYRDNDGFYYISGRLKRFVKLFGKRVSLDEVQALLGAQFKGCEFASYGNDTCLFIGVVGPIDLATVTDFASSQLSVNRIAIRAIKLSELPRLGNGKIDYGALAIASS